MHKSAFYISTIIYFGHKPSTELTAETEESVEAGTDEEGSEDETDDEERWVWESLVTQRDISSTSNKGKTVQNYFLEKLQETNNIHPFVVEARARSFIKENKACWTNSWNF